MPGWTGYIEQKLFQGGQTVKTGTRLYLLDQRTFSAEVQKAKAAVAKAEADLQYAKEGVEVFRAQSRLAQSRASLIKTEQDVARYEPLVKEQAASQQDLDSSIAQRDVSREEVEARKTELTQTKLTQRTQIALATAELEAARASLRLADLNLGYTDILRPCDRPYCRVGRLCRQPGDEKFAQASDEAVPPRSDSGKGEDRRARLPQLHPHLESESRGETKANRCVVSLSAPPG